MRVVTVMLVMMLRVALIALVAFVVLLALPGLRALLALMLRGGASWNGMTLDCCKRHGVAIDKHAGVSSYSECQMTDTHGKHRSHGNCPRFASTSLPMSHAP